MVEYATGQLSYIYYTLPSGETGRKAALGVPGRRVARTWVERQGGQVTRVTYGTTSGREAVVSEPTPKPKEPKEAPPTEPTRDGFKKFDVEKWVKEREGKKTVVKFIHPYTKKYHLMTINTLLIKKCEHKNINHKNNYNKYHSAKYFKNQSISF